MVRGGSRSAHQVLEQLLAGDSNWLAGIDIQAVVQEPAQQVGCLDFRLLEQGEDAVAVRVGGGFQTALAQCREQRGLSLACLQSETWMGVLPQVTQWCVYEHAPIAQDDDVLAQG